jgi:hypothetical protein
VVNNLELPIFIILSPLAYPFVKYPFYPSEIAERLRKVS